VIRRTSVGEWFVFHAQYMTLKKREDESVSPITVPWMLCSACFQAFSCYCTALRSHNGTNSERIPRAVLEYYHTAMPRSTSMRQSFFPARVSNPTQLLKKKHVNQLHIISLFPSSSFFLANVSRVARKPLSTRNLGADVGLDSAQRSKVPCGSRITPD
jgi:hypothetical protein